MTTPLTTRRARRARTAGAALVAALALTVAPLTTAQAAPSPAPAPSASASASASTAGGAAARWTTRDLSAQKAVGSVSITADGTVDLLQISVEWHGDSGGEWTGRLYRQSRSGKRTFVRSFTSGKAPSLRTGEDGSSILTVPGIRSQRTTVWIRKNGSTRWTKHVAPKDVFWDVAADTQRNGKLTLAYVTTEATGSTLWTRTRVPGRSWSARQKVATVPDPAVDGIGAVNTFLDVSANGAAVVAAESLVIPWGGPGGANLYAASRAPGAARFGRGTKVASGDVSRIAVAQAGSKSIVAWAADDDTGLSTAVVRTRADAKSRWGKAQKVMTTRTPTSGDYDYLSIDLAGSPDGRATLVHKDYAGTARVRVLDRGKDTSFSKPALTVTRVRTALLAQRHNGAATLVTVTGDASATTGKLAVRTSNKAGTRWSKARTLGTAVTGWEGAQSLAVARGGAAAVTWKARASGAGSHFVASHR